MISTIADNRNLRPARVITFGLIVAIMGLYIAGLVVHAQALQQVCLDPQEMCAQVPTHLTLAEYVSLQANGLSLSTYATLQVVKLLVYATVWFFVGGLILVRAPNQWMSLVVAFTFMTFPTGFDGLYDTLAQAYPALALPVHVCQYVINLTWPLFMALFPTGRWSPPWARWIVVLCAVVALPQYFASGWSAGIGLGAGTGQVIILAANLGLHGVLLAAQVLRYYRHSTPPERLQTRWVVLGLGTGLGIVAGMVVVLGTGLVPAIGWLARFGTQIVYQTAVVLIPISVAAAILRYRLFDIDLIIRRTLVYSLLTVLLALVYFGGITLLQSLFTAITGQSSPAALVISTLLIAALFTPLRQRVQDFIDRRFYRRRYDIEQALAEFAAEARAETNVEAMTSRLISVTQEALQPQALGLWLKEK